MHSSSPASSGKTLGMEMITVSVRFKSSNMVMCLFFRAVWLSVSFSSYTLSSMSRTCQPNTIQPSVYRLRGVFILLFDLEAFDSEFLPGHAAAAVA